MVDTCGNCNAYLRHTDKQGWCRARPPNVLVTGIIAPKIQGQKPQPEISALFPPMDKDSWCRKHQPLAPMSSIDMTKLRDLEVEGNT
jgi:hypothetical protein